MWILKLVVIYLPLQEFLLKWLPVTESVFFLLRQLPEFLLLLLSAALAARELSAKRIPYSGERFEAYLLCFLLSAILSALLNPLSDKAIVGSELFVLLRYFAVVFCLIALRPSEKEIRSLLLVVFISFALQAFLGYLQLVGGEAVRQVFVARSYVNVLSEVSREFTGGAEGGRQSIIGTGGDFINFAYMMAVAVACALSFFRKGTKLLFLLGVLLVILFFSGSRTIFLSTLLLVAIALAWTKSLNLRVALFLVAGFGLIAVFGVLVAIAETVQYDYKSFWALFKSETVLALLNQRLGVLVYFIPEYIRSGHFLFGFSADRFYIGEVVWGDYLGVPTILAAVLDFVFEDLYFAALFGYYGLFGLAFFIAAWVQIFRVAKRLAVHGDGLAGKIGVATLMLLFLAIPLNMANQAFEARYFAFYLWLFAGLCLYCGRGVRQNPMPSRPGGSKNAGIK